MIGNGNDLIQKTFSFDSDILPTIPEIKNLIVTDDIEFEFDVDKNHKNFEIRDQYTKNSFPILTHEFFSSAKKMATALQIKKIAELHAGIGWLSYWSKKYELPLINSVDNMTWKGFENRYLKHVKKCDSIDFVKENPKIDLFILSWPYMDETAYKIWQNMKNGQYLLYVGEDCGGCTADEDFFRVTKDSGIKDVWNLSKNFISFWGVHDRPSIYKKN